VYSLSATLVDPTTLEPVTARWFVDYNQYVANLYAVQHTVDNSDIEVSVDDPTGITREVPAWAFAPHLFMPPPGTYGGAPPPNDAAGVMHVVELVVANGGFNDKSVTMPNRTPIAGFEAQVYRWVFINSQSAPCPPP
jgi:hypothetical protein